MKYTNLYKTFLKIGIRVLFHMKLAESLNHYDNTLAKRYYVFIEIEQLSKNNLYILLGYFNSYNEGNLL